MGWLRRNSRVVIGIASAGAGAALGAGLQEALDTELRTVGAIAAVLSLTLIGILASQSVMMDSAESANRHLLSNSKSLRSEIRAVHDRQAVELRELADRLQKNIQMLVDQSGLQVDRQLLSDVNQMPALEDDPSAHMLLAVKNELRVLDLLSDDGRWADEAMDQAHMDQFFERLADVIKAAKPAPMYKRIVQVRDPSKALRVASNKTFIRHCYAMLELRAEQTRKVTLRVAPRRFPFKFALIDNDGLILQLQEYDPSGAALTVWGEIRMSDPNGSFISIFREIWDQLEEDPMTRTVTIDDLPTLGGQG